MGAQSSGEIMEDQIYRFLKGLPLFARLPKKEVSYVAGEIEVKTYPRSTILAVQGRTKLDCVYIIREGSMELFYETDGEKAIKGILEPGEIFGGVSILMNAGISVRTIQVVADATLYVLPHKVFLEVCTRHKNLYEHFAGRFRAQMSNESYASVVTAGQALHFISGLVPFSFLPEEEISNVAAQIAIINYPKDTMLFLQGQSKIEYLYIIKKGAAERYFEEEDQKTLRGLLGEGDMYGGISMLMNNSVAIRTLRVTEDSYFYILPKEIFLAICKKYEVFSDYFTDAFILCRNYCRKFETGGGFSGIFQSTGGRHYQPESGVLRSRHADSGGGRRDERVQCQLHFCARNRRRVRGGRHGQ